MPTSVAAAPAGYSAPAGYTRLAPAMPTIPTPANGSVNDTAVNDVSVSTAPEPDAGSTELFVGSLQRRRIERHVHAVSAAAVG